MSWLLKRNISQWICLGDNPISLQNVAFYKNRQKFCSDAKRDWDETQLHSFNQSGQNLLCISKTAAHIHLLFFTGNSAFKLSVRESGINLKTPTSLRFILSENDARKCKSLNLFIVHPLISIILVQKSLKRAEDSIQEYLN